MCFAQTHKRKEKPFNFIQLELFNTVAVAHHINKLHYQNIAISIIIYHLSFQDKIVARKSIWHGECEQLWAIAQRVGFTWT